MDGDRVRLVLTTAAADVGPHDPPNPEGRVQDTVGRVAGEGAEAFAVARYKADGSLDGTFGSGGRVLTDVIGGGADAANAVALQADGKVIAAGSAPARIGSDFAVVRYSGSGSLDAGFGSGGVARADFGATDFFGSNLGIQADGRILGVGFSDAAGTNDFAIARFNVDGTLDPNFGTGGKVLTDFGGSTPSGDEAYGLAIQDNGRIVAAGSASAAGPGGGFALARYNP